VRAQFSQTSADVKNRGEGEGFGSCFSCLRSCQITGKSDELGLSRGKNSRACSWGSCLGEVRGSGRVLRLETTLERRNCRRGRGQKKSGARERKIGLRSGRKSTETSQKDYKTKGQRPGPSRDERRRVRYFSENLNERRGEEKTRDSTAPSQPVETACKISSMRREE